MGFLIAGVVCLLAASGMGVFFWYKLKYIHKLDSSIVEENKITTKPDVDIVIQSDLVEISELQLKESLEATVNSIFNNENVIGLSQETVNTIKSALDDSKYVRLNAEIIMNKVSEDSLDQHSLDLIKQAIANHTITDYFDLSLQLSVYVNDVYITQEKITSLSQPLTFTMYVGNLSNGRYYLVSKDGSTIQVQNNNQRITFETNTFSTYALVCEEIVENLCGDVNRDGKVNAEDRRILTRTMAYWYGYLFQDIDMTAADVDQDGRITKQDRVILTRHLAGWEGYETLPY